MEDLGGEFWEILGGTGREELGQERAETEKQDLR
jgi:hypothetical protein